MEVRFSVFTVEEMEGSGWRLEMTRTYALAAIKILRSCRWKFCPVQIYGTCLVQSLRL